MYRELIVTEPGSNNPTTVGLSGLTATSRRGLEEEYAALGYDVKGVE